MAGPYSIGAKLRIIGKLQNQDCINVLHFGAINQAWDNPDAIAQALAALGVAMLQCAFANLKEGVTSDWTLVGIETSQIFPVKGPTIFTPPGQATQGQLSAASVSFAASLVSVSTAIGGRSGKGRIFLPPPGEAETTNSALTQSPIDALTAFLTCMAGKFIGDAATEQWRFGVLSSKAIKAGTSFNDAFHEAVAVAVKPSLAVMRSRKVGHGN